MYLCPDNEPFFDKRSAKAITCVPMVASQQSWSGRLLKQEPRFFLNPPNCLYLQKVCDFIQNYEISERNGKKSALFFPFPNEK